MDLSVDEDALVDAIYSEQASIMVSDNLSDVEKKKMILEFLREDESYANENGFFGILQISDRLGIWYKDVDVIVNSAPEEMEICNFRARAFYGHTFPIEFHQTMIPGVDYMLCDVTEEEYESMMTSGRLRSHRHSKVHLYSDERYLPRPKGSIILEIDTSFMIEVGYRFYQSGPAILCDEIPLWFIRKSPCSDVEKITDNWDASDE